MYLYIYIYISMMMDDDDDDDGRSWMMMVDDGWRWVKMDEPDRRKSPRAPYFVDLELCIRAVFSNTLHAYRRPLGPIQSRFDSWKSDVYKYCYNPLDKKVRITYWNSGCSSSTERGKTGKKKKFFLEWGLCASVCHTDFSKHDAILQRIQPWPRKIPIPT